jgi:hypothetical protein
MSGIRVKIGMRHEAEGKSGLKADAEKAVIVVAVRKN